MVYEHCCHPEGCGSLVEWWDEQIHLHRTKLELQKCHWTAIWNTWMNQYGQDGEKRVTCLRLFFKVLLGGLGQFLGCWSTVFLVYLHPAEMVGDSLLRKWFLFLRVFFVTTRGLKFVLMESSPKTNVVTQNSHLWKQIHFENTIIFGSYVTFRGCSRRGTGTWCLDSMLLGGSTSSRGSVEIHFPFP